MSAISHKVNTENYLVNDYLRGFADSRTSPGSCVVIYAFYLFKPEPLLELEASHDRYPHYQNSYPAEK